MSERLAELAARKQRLQTICAQQRADVARQLQPWVRTGTALEHAGKIGRWLFEHRVWILAAATLILVRRPRRILSVAARGWGLWKLVGRARSWLGFALPLIARLSQR